MARVKTYSAADTGLGPSIVGVGMGNCGGVGSSHGESMSSSLSGVISGEGDGRGTGSDRSLRKLKGALCGRGEMSMESGTKPGDEEGIGGVVTPSHLNGGVTAPSVQVYISIYDLSLSIALPLTP